jgi:hypothetical protein
MTKERILQPLLAVALFTGGLSPDIADPLGVLNGNEAIAI